MKKHLLTTLVLGAIFPCLLTGCDKNEFNHAGLEDINTVTDDSLCCKIWLQNALNDTTNLFRKGEDVIVCLSVQNLRKETIYIPTRGIFTSRPSIYRAKDDSFAGYPYSYLYDASLTIAPVPHGQTLTDTFTILEGKTSDERTLPKGEYYLKITYRTTFYQVDTAHIEPIRPIESIAMKEMRVKFKLK